MHLPPPTNHVDFVPPIIIIFDFFNLKSVIILSFKNRKRLRWLELNNNLLIYFCIFFLENKLCFLWLSPKISTQFYYKNLLQFVKLKLKELKFYFSLHLTQRIRLMNKEWTYWTDTNTLTLRIDDDNCHTWQYFHDCTY